MQCNMTAVLIVAHAPLASALKAVAGHVYADCGHAVEALDVSPGSTPEAVLAQAKALMVQSPEADWLVLTDVFGATPCNAMQRLANPDHVRVLTGVNVPMLWRTLCYANESLEALAARAMGGATAGVMQVGDRPPLPQGNPLPPCDQVPHHHQQ